MMKVRFLFSKVMTWFFLVFGIFTIFFLYPIAGFYFENGYFSLHDFFFANIHGNFKYTFGELILDVEHLLANFITNVIFSLVFSFFCLNYGHSKEERKLFGNEKRFQRRSMLFGLIITGILVTAITLSLLNIGLDRPELDGKTFEMMLLNLHPNNFSSQAVFYMFTFSGFPGIFYIASSSRIKVKRGTWKQDWSNVGILYIIIALSIVSLIVVLSPVIPWVILHPDDAARQILFALLDLTFMTGMVLLLDNLDRAKGLKQGDEILRQHDGERIIVSNYDKHGWAWFSGMIAFVVIVVLYALNENFDARIGIWLFISRTWSFAFTMFFSLFLISLGNYFMAKKTGVEVAQVA